jgi:hypothetical protein
MTVLAKTSSNVTGRPIDEKKNEEQTKMKEKMMRE